MSSGILDKLYYEKVAGHGDWKTPENAEADFYYEALFDEIRKYIPKGDRIDVENRFYFLVNACATSRAENAFKNGAKFATRFMSEVFQPEQKTYHDFETDLKKLLE